MPQEPAFDAIDGRARQVAARTLWESRCRDNRSAAIIVGISGAGKSEQLVRPLVRHVHAEGTHALMIDVPPEPLDLAAELYGALVQAAEEVGDQALVSMVARASAFPAAVRAILQVRGLVVIDEVQRLLDQAGRPLGAWAESLARLARRNTDGGSLWLVSNREVDPEWAEPFVVVPFEAPQADEIEWLKGDRDDDAGTRAEIRTEEEIALGKSAHRVVAVGPRLHGRVVGDLGPYECPPPLRFDPGFDRLGDPHGAPPGDPWRVLLLGRAEDAVLKGLDLAAAALGRVARNRTGLPRIELVVRGAPVGTADALRERLQEWAASPALDVVVRPYTTRGERLEADLRRASLVLMPSRREGFGLVGVEAIVAGTPVLVSAESGLGRLLLETLEREDAARFVLPVTGDRDADVSSWAENIGAVLRDRDAAFRRAGALRERMGREKTWAASVALLLASVTG